MASQSLSRRSFLSSSAVTAALIGTGSFSGTARSAVDSLAPMTITKIEAVRFKPGFEVHGRAPFWTWILVHTDAGITGIGETYPFTEGQIGVLRDLQERSWMGKIIGRDPKDINNTWRDIFKQAAFNGWGGSDMRALSALNMAQYDILGKALNVPAYSLLGGMVNEKIRVYNTYRNINGWDQERDVEKYVRFLVDKGISAVKLFIYNGLASQNGGTYITQKQIEDRLTILKRVRDAVGNDIDIGLEFNSGWNLPCAERIAASVEPYGIIFLEDMLLQDNVRSYARLAAETPIPICISERLATRYQFREMLEDGAADIVMYDLTWCGGISSGIRISDMADTYYIPTILHTCGGPLLWFASLQVASSLMNLHIMESSHHYYSDYYPYFVEDVPVPENGYVSAPDRPGLGMTIRPELFERGEATIETITGG